MIRIKVDLQALVLDKIISLTLFSCLTPINRFPIKFGQMGNLTDYRPLSV
jgi:hypothetical protein